MGYSPWGCKESDTTEATEPACTNLLLGQDVQGKCVLIGVYL